jgi:hypothetical protein
MAGGRVCGGSALYLAAGYDYATGTKTPAPLSTAIAVATAVLGPPSAEVITQQQLQALIDALVEIGFQRGDLEAWFQPVMGSTIAEVFARLEDGILNGGLIVP